MTNQQYYDINCDATGRAVIVDAGLNSECDIRLEMVDGKLCLCDQDESVPVDPADDMDAEMAAYAVCHNVAALADDEEIEWDNGDE